MESTQDKYPVFEANQVLTAGHLNEIFNYLDDQERLTRANLIGIGIVCGLEIRVETTGADITVHLAKGCGVTSKGYLIVEPGDVALVSYGEPLDDLGYPPFKDKNANPVVQYQLWEMFPAGEPETTLFGTIPDFLDDKAVLLFLELKKEDLRNCGPTNCDDKGSQVTPTVRRLLIKVDDLGKIIAEANGLGAGLTFTDLETALLARLNLPDLRLPHFDVPNTGLATSNEVFAAFQAVFQGDNLARNTGDALTAAYNAFKPVVEGMYPADPFASFSGKFGFLDTALQTIAQVRFLQYYYDFFDDLLKAYDEFRWKGVELMCACCPPEGLFPRHLMLGVLFPASVPNPGIYRHHFLSSPAVGGCEERVKELKLLFRRLVEMIANLTNAPPLPQQPPASKVDAQIRITPSKLADVPVSAKAIPYYYVQDGDPPLYHIWSPEKSRRNRANQNLSYRSDEYTPTPPAFVINPLHYDLEPHNFLRIEGHLGKNYRSVLNTLLSLKRRYRLPIEIIALRTGAFDEKISVDLSKEECRFQDLEALYDALREGILCSLCEGVRYFYDIPLDGQANIPFIVPAGNGPAEAPDESVPQLPLLKQCAPGFRYKKNTVGAWYEANLAAMQSIPYIDIDQNAIDGNGGVLFQAITLLFFRMSPSFSLSPPNLIHFASIYYLSKLAEVLPPKLHELVYTDFENRYLDLTALIRYFRSDARGRISDDDLKEFIPQEDLIDRFDRVLSACKLEPLKAIHEEYLRRIREVKQKQFLSFFLQKSPGIQHKAGVPLGGTFIIVYHDDPQIVFKPNTFTADNRNLFSSAVTADAGNSANSHVSRPDISDAFTRISANRELASNPDIRFLLGILTDQVPDFGISTIVVGGNGTDIIDQAVNELADGTVIADFFLPYLCCSDCPPINYVLPAPPLGVAVQIGCTNADGFAEVTVTPQGGTASFTYQLNAEPFLPLTGNLLLETGTYTLVIRDSAGAESAQKSVIVPAQLTFGEERYIDNVAAQTYQVSFNISGGTPPYRAESGAITGDENTYTSEPVESEETVTVEIVDNAGCIKSQDFKNIVPPPCDLPCNGIVQRCGYRFWIPEPELEKEYKDYRAEVLVFKFDFPEGSSIDIRGEVKEIIQSPPSELNTVFSNVVQSWLKRINAVIAAKTSRRDRLELEYTMSGTHPPFGTLWIRHFNCLKFEFTINPSYRRPDSMEEPFITYTPEGTTIRILRDAPPLSVPRFNCTQTDECDPNRPTVDFCEKTDLSLEIIESEVTVNTVSLDAISTGVDSPDSYLWEVEDGIPPFSNEKKANFKFEQVEPSVKNIRLIAYTKEGCQVIKESKIDLRNP